jgi:hypothetical protein
MHVRVKPVSRRLGHKPVSAPNLTNKNRVQASDKENSMRKHLA